MGNIFALRDLSPNYIWVNFLSQPKICLCRHRIEMSHKIGKQRHATIQVIALRHELFQCMDTSCMPDVMDARSGMATDIWYSCFSQNNMIEDVLDNFLGKSISPVIHEKWRRWVIYGFASYTTSKNYILF